MAEEAVPHIHHCCQRRLCINQQRQNRSCVFQDYVNEAAKGTTADHKVAWFQLDGNTYVVQNNSILNSFENGVDDYIYGIIGFLYKQQVEDKK